MANLCAVASCPAFARPGSEFCPGHVYAKRLQFVFTGTRCLRCGRDVHAGDYVTRESTTVDVTHAQCPAPAPPTTRRRRDELPLLDACGL